MDNFKHKKLLICDNKKKTLSIHNDVFKSLFGNYDYHTDLDSAFEKYSNNFYHIIFINISKNENVISFIKNIRKITKNKPIVLFYDNLDSLSLNLYQTYYIDGIIALPFLKKHLVSLLENIFERQEEQDAVFTYLREMEKGKTIQEDQKKQEKQEIVRKIIIENYDYTEPISAAQLFEEFDETIVDKIEELYLLVNEFNDFVFQIDVNIGKKDVLQKWINKLAKTSENIANTIFYFQCFRIAIGAFKELSDILQKINLDTVSEKDLKIIVDFLYLLEKDISNWLTNIFIERKTDNIYYFDSSLLSNIKSIEIYIDQDIQNNEQEIEWF